MSDDPALVPPHDLTAEHALLGAIVMGGRIGSAALDLALESLTAESFYSEANRQTYAAIVAVQERGVTVDALSVLACLKDRGRLSQVGEDYVSRLANAGLLASTFDGHVRRLAELARLRAFIHQTRALVVEAYGAREDVGAFLGRAESAIREVTYAGEKRTGETAFVVVRRVLTELAQGMKSPGRLVGMPSGVDGLDRRTGGFRNGTVIILAGRPGMGKSACALNWATYMARTTGLVIPFFSLEMSNDEQGMRAIATETTVPMGAMISGSMTEAAMADLIGYPKTLHGVPLVFFDECKITPQGIGAKVRRLQSEAAGEGKRVGAVFVDYLQLVSATKRNQSREADVAEVSRSLKLLSKELQVPMIVLAQLNREGEKGTKPERPKLSQLRESGSIEQDADIVIFIHRDGYYTPDAKDDTAELIIAKGRNIQKGVVRVSFDGRHTRFGRQELDGYPGAPS